MSTAVSRDKLAHEWAEMRTDKRGIRIRDAADHLGCSEAELLLSAEQSPDLFPDLNVALLDGEAAELFELTPRFGHVMALTRNDAVVSETYGSYADIERHGNGALVHTEGIDLRTDFSHWHHAFAVESKRGDHSLLGLQFFDADGTAVHKVYLTDRSPREAFFDARERFAAGAQVQPAFTAAPPSVDAAGADTVDRKALRAGWRGLTNVHGFTGLLKSLGVRRLAAVRQIGPEFATRVSTTGYRDLLEAARDAGIPIMVFVRSRGCTQIHSGPIEKLMESGEYFNIFDPEFHLHIREPRLAEAWIVKKPTKEDIVTALEFYGPGGELCLQIFGVRDKEGKESPAWRHCVESVPAV